MLEIRASQTSWSDSGAGGEINIGSEWVELTYRLAAVYRLLAAASAAYREGKLKVIDAVIRRQFTVVTIDIYFQACLLYTSDAADE